LEGIVFLIEEIRKLFQAPSLSIGVHYKGSTLWTKGFGYANLETELVPDSSTVYSIGSCTKGFTGTALSLLAQRGTVDLGDTVSSKIPGLETVNNPKVAEKMTIRDMLSHCAGLSSMPFEVLGRDGHVLAEYKDIVHIFNHLPQAAPFKSEWTYNNWLFALAGTLIVQESGSSYGKFIQREILKKIGMKRTFTSAPVDQNHALPYLVFEDENKAPMPVNLPHLDDGVAFDSSGAVRSCVDDLLLWSRALMEAHPSRCHDKSLETLQDPGCFSAAAQKPHFPLSGGRDRNQQYALGLFNLQLPTTEMNLVTNPDVNSRDYSIGKDSGAPRPVIGHTGELGGFLSAYWTFPEDDCAIVVLTNSFQINGDPTNIIAQLLTQTVFNMKPWVDFMEVAQNVVDNAKSRWDTVVEQLGLHRVPGTSPKSLDAYVGQYENQGLAMRLNVSLSGDESYPLHLCINGLEGQVFELYHYHTDSWTFVRGTRDECIEKGYAMYLLSWESWIIEFDVLESGQFLEVKWRLDTDERLEPQVFLRT
ncbi:uncharacterized protein NECHADRAFT_53115, partial [Fusarium vanettenii 77-13-4]